MDDLIDTGNGELLSITRGPMDRHFRARASTQSEMLPREAGLAEDGLRLETFSRLHSNAGADDGAIRSRPGELHFQPVIGRFQVVAKQTRRFVAIPNHDVDIAVIIEIA
jgi:hypothetical protein